MQTGSIGESEIIQLPDGRVLAAGGMSAILPPPVPHKRGVVKWTDLYDPRSDSWRRIADMIYFREYHAVTLLVPDGRVITTGGTVVRMPPAVSADIVAFDPPYLFRGVRPRLTGLSNNRLSRGETIVLSVFPDTRITSLVLTGTHSHTHWVDAGVPRRLVLPVTQTGNSVRATLPTDSNVLPLGHYVLFAMVDDIPSVGRIVRVVQ